MLDIFKVFSNYLKMCDITMRTKHGDRPQNGEYLRKHWLIVTETLFGYSTLRRT